MRKHTYTKVLAHKGVFTQSARAYHLATKGHIGQDPKIRANALHAAYKLDVKAQVSA
jgi:hypothetical protein